MKINQDDFKATEAVRIESFHRSVAEILSNIMSFRITQKTLDALQGRQREQFAVRVWHDVCALGLVDENPAAQEKVRGLVNAGLVLGFTTELYCFLYVVLELHHAKNPGMVKNALDKVLDRQLTIRRKKQLLIQTALEMNAP